MAHAADLSGQARIPALPGRVCTMVIAMGGYAAPITGVSRTTLYGSMITRQLRPSR